MSKKDKRNAIAEWKIQGPKEDAHRKKRNLYFIPEDHIADYWSTLKDARALLEVPPAPAMPCDTTSASASPGEIPGTTSTRAVATAGDVEKVNAEKHSASRLSDEWFVLVHKPIDICKAKQIPLAIKAFDKEWEKLEAKPAWKLSSVRLKNDVIVEANKTGVKIHLGSLMALCHLKNAQLGE